MILVTGGTGLVGAHLLYHLSLQENRIRATYRSKSKIDKTKHVFTYFTEQIDSLFDKIEWVEADILDIPKLNDSFEGITHVYHCAALVSFDPKDYHMLRKINIEGTANVVNLCISKNIEKLCYVSSIATLGNSQDNSLITEDSHWNPEADNSVYAITKYGAEMEVWRAAQEGLKTVIVNPGVILGGGFWKSGSGSLFRMIFKGMKYYTNGVFGYVDVNDVTKGMMELMNNKIEGERFIMVSENWSFKDFTHHVARALKVIPPKKEAKRWLLQFAWRMDWLRCFFNGKPRRLTKQTVSTILDNRNFSNKKICKVLKLNFIPIEKSIAETCSQFLKDLES